MKGKRKIGDVQAADVEEQEDEDGDVEYHGTL